MNRSIGPGFTRQVLSVVFLLVGATFASSGTIMVVARHATSSEWYAAMSMEGLAIPFSVVGLLGLRRILSHK